LNNLMFTCLTDGDFDFTVDEGQNKAFLNYWYKVAGI